MKWALYVSFGVTLSVVVSCASPWKIHGGPRECTQMCQRWGMELVGMVGVGNQDESGAGATACVCELPGKTRSAHSAASGTVANSAAVIVAIEEQQRAAAAAANAGGAVPR